MTMMFNAVEFIHRLEGEGLSRGAAEAIAAGIDEGRRDLVTRADLQADLLLTKADLEASLARTVARQTVQFGVMLGAASAIVVAAIGAIVSAH